MPDVLGHRSPSFNRMLAGQALALGIPVLFVISPQFWAWRPGRIEKLADRISKMIVALSLRGALHRAGQGPVAFRSPAVEGLARRPASRDAALHHFGLDPAPHLVLAPGSRPNETAHLVPRCSAPPHGSREHPDWQFAVPLAPRVDDAVAVGAPRSAGIEIVTTARRHLRSLRGRRFRNRVLRNSDLERPRSPGCRW